MAVAGSNPTKSIWLFGVELAVLVIFALTTLCGSIVVVGLAVMAAKFGGPTVSEFAKAVINVLITALARL